MYRKFTIMSYALRMKFIDMNQHKIENKISQSPKFLSIRQIFPHRNECIMVESGYRKTIVNKFLFDHKNGLVPSHNWAKLRSDCLFREIPQHKCLNEVEYSLMKLQLRCHARIHFMYMKHSSNYINSCILLLLVVVFAKSFCCCFCCYCLLLLFAGSFF